MTQNIGDRMKENYENRYRLFLTRRTPVIMRLDGRAFHTKTKDLERPFDGTFHRRMCSTAVALLEGLQGAKCAYIQSDEISVLLTDFDTLTTEAAFDYNIQKLVSISASIASVHLSRMWEKAIEFDSRVFNIPKEEVANYFIWRQKDWERNSLYMYARSIFSHKELMNKGKADIHEMLHNEGLHWGDLYPQWKRGSFFYKVEREILWTYALFVEERDLIEQFLEEDDGRSNRASETMAVV